MKMLKAPIPYPTDADLLHHGMPLEQEPTALVIHAIGEYIGEKKWENHCIQFLNREKLSAHLFIDPDGGMFQCREFYKIAWHAKGFNESSIGVEVMVKGSHDYGSFREAIKKDWVSEESYKSLVELSRDIIATYDIRSVVRHSDIDPDRKIDPGDGFPWKRFLNDIGM